jgi:hypothetical protein
MRAFDPTRTQAARDLCGAHCRTPVSLGALSCFDGRVEAGLSWGEEIRRREFITLLGGPPNASKDGNLQSPADALGIARVQVAGTEIVAITYAERERVIAEAQAVARAIIVEAERAAQDIVARAMQIMAEADRALDDAKSKALSIQKRAQAALALAENVAKSRRLIDALGE